jgi:3-hydroxyisobutyrate dehydrogenase-like beta-hydroxyacid dehydrogenase
VASVDRGLVVGFVGLGSQGGPMARRILEDDWPLMLYARRPETLDPFAGTGVAVAGSLSELGAGVSLLCVCVVDDAQVSEVVLGDGGALSAMRPGATIAVHSTIHPDTARELGAAAAERGVDFLDAPVSGGGQAAADGRLTVMVGGEHESFERWRPVFVSYGDPVVWLGPIGSGQVAKLVNNLLFTAELALAHDAVDLGRRLGLEPEGLTTALQHSSGRSYALELFGMTGSLAPLTAAAALLEKDLELVGDVGARASVDLGLLEAAARRALELLRSHKPAP